MKRKTQNSWIYKKNRQLKGVVGAEDLGIVQGRASKTINKISKKNQGIAVIVSHGLLNKCFLTKLMQMPLENVARIDQKNCCINIIEYDTTNKKFTVKSVNNIDHLEEGINHD